MTKNSTNLVNYLDFLRGKNDPQSHQSLKIDGDDIDSIFKTTIQYCPVGTTTWHFGTCVNGSTGNIGLGVKREKNTDEKFDFHEMLKIGMESGEGRTMWADNAYGFWFANHQRMVIIRIR